MQTETSPRDTEDRAQPSPIDTTAASKGHHRSLFIVLTVASFVGAGLLFSVQPMVAKMLLPLLGGSAAVWNTAMVFFQLVLLLGYAYAHFAVSRLRPRTHRLVQVGLISLPLIVLPIAVPAGWIAPSTTSPLGWVLITLLVMVGAPFFALATLSPTLQRWLAETDHPSAGNPYFLYSASNAGSLLSLLAYPLVLEPLLDVPAQTRLWTAFYVTLMIMIGAAAWLARPRSTTDDGTPAAVLDGGERPSWRRRGFWVYAAFVPSALMLAVTRHISTDVASFPLLWVVPLSLYLLTFVIAFRGEPVNEVRFAAGTLRFTVIALVLGWGQLRSTWLLIVLPLVVFTAAALMAHGRLMLARPAPARLTEFYLWISIGGAAGGVFASLIAPTVFDSILEYPIALALALTLLPVAKDRLQRRTTIVAFAAVALAVVAALVRRSGNMDPAIVLAAVVSVVAFALLRKTKVFTIVMVILIAAPLLGRSGDLLTDRTFFGVHRVSETASGTHILWHGTTIHGVQANFGEPTPALPSNYYHPSGPIGQLLLDRRARPELDVAVLGLGAGTLSAYSRPGDHYTFYEIDPVVLEIARDPNMFTYLEEAEGEVTHVIGDGRIMLDLAEERYDLIVLDAFSSDSIPTHLITEEAVRGYAERLREDGLIAVHISNRHLDLEPVIGRLAEELGFVAYAQHYFPPTEALDEGALPTRWVVLAPSVEALQGLEADAAWQPARRDAALWTDAYTSILEIFRWR